MKTVAFMAALLMGSAAQACERWLARLASATGPVEAQTVGADWRVASAGETYCADVSLRVGAGGSAAVELANDTLLRLSADSGVHPPEPERAAADRAREPRAGSLSEPHAATLRRFDAVPERCHRWHRIPASGRRRRRSERPRP